MRGHREEGASQGLFTESSQGQPAPQRAPADSGRRRLCLLACSTLLITGCAVQSGPGGKLKVGLDGAALLGNELATFKLADGSDGTLRSLNGDYSLKLERFFRVIPLGKKRAAQLERAVQLDDRTVLVIHQVDERGCLSTTVVSIRGSEASMWDLKSGNCRVKPDVVVLDNRMVLLYEDHGYVYGDGKLVRAKRPPPEAPATPPATAQPGKPAEPARPRAPRNEADGRRAPSSASRSTPAARNTSGPSSSASSATSNSPTGNASPSATVPARSGRPARSSALPDLDFRDTGVEEKPITIDLGKKK